MIYFGEKYEDMSEKLITKERSVVDFCLSNHMLGEWSIETASDMILDYYIMKRELGEDAIKEWCYKYRYKMKMLKEEYR